MKLNVFKTASQLVWISAGKPEVKKGKTKNINSRCAICGGFDSTVFLLNEICPKASFSGYPDMQWPSSRWCCRGCSWSMEGRPPDTLRMWSILYKNNKHQLMNKSNMDEIGFTLIDPPSGYWSVSIADSGKLHVLPYTRTNYGNGKWCIRMDRENVFGDRRTFGQFLYHISCLIDAGYSRKSILTRQPKITELKNFGIDTWKNHISCLPYKGGTSLEYIATLISRKDVANEWSRRTEEFC